MSPAPRAEGAGTLQGQHWPPRPVMELWDWQLRAACRGQDPETFFHPVNERGPSRRKRDTDAKTICSTCPVTRSCLHWALIAGEEYGVWGGMTVEERDALRNTLGRRIGR